MCLEVDVGEVLAADHCRQEKFDADGRHHPGGVVDGKNLFPLGFGHYSVRNEQKALDNRRVRELFELVHVFLAEADGAEAPPDNFEDAVANLIDDFCRRMDVVVGERHPGSSNIQVVFQEVVAGAVVEPTN